MNCPGVILEGTSNNCHQSSGARIYPRMIPLCSRFDSVLFTPKMSAIASYGNYSRSPKVYGYAQPSSPRWHRSTAVSGYTGPFRHRGSERAWRDASSAIRSDQWEGWNFDRYGNSTVESIRFEPGDLARFANGVRSLAGACAHTFAKGSAF